MSVIVLISGRGENLRSILQSDVSHKISCVITDNDKANGIKIAKSYNKKIKIIKYNSLFSDQLLEFLINQKPQLIVLAGFMRILSEKIINEFEGRIINIHPSLLPKHKGLNTHMKVLENKDKFHGCTVHFVDAGIDTGKIIAQDKIKVMKTDDCESLKQKVLDREIKLYPKVIKQLLKDMKLIY